MVLSADRKDWARKALSENIVAITVAMLTTLAGFLALNFSISPPFQQLGNVVAAGEAAGLFFTLCLLRRWSSLFSYLAIRKKRLLTMG